MAGAGVILAALAADLTRPPLRRATAASLLARNDFPGARDALVRALGDPEPLVRYGALEAVRGLPPSERLPLAAPLLRDPILTVRIDAARTLAAVPKEQMRAGERAAFEAALAEYERSLAVDVDRAEAHLSLAELATDLGDLARAEREYRIAMDLVPAFAASYGNMADLYRVQGRDVEAEQVLRRGLSAAPGDAGLHHALGLALVRQKRLPEALVELERAAKARPGGPVTSTSGPSLWTRPARPVARSTCSPPRSRSTAGIGRSSRRSCRSTPEPEMTSRPHATRGSWKRLRDSRRLHNCAPAASGRAERYEPAASRRPARKRRDDVSRVYFSISSLRPSAATLMLAPFVSLLRLITTPLGFLREETPAPLPAVPSAPAAAKMPLKSSRLLRL